MTAVMALLVAPQGRVLGIEKVAALADQSIKSLQVNRWLNFVTERNAGRVFPEHCPHNSGSCTALSKKHCLAGITWSIATCCRTHHVSYFGYAFLIEPLCSFPGAQQYSRLLPIRHCWLFAAYRYHNQNAVHHAVYTYNMVQTATSLSNASQVTE